MELTGVQRDRARGVLLGVACGDALGAPIEFGPVFPYPRTLEMRAGHTWEPGEWTDDTSMAIVIARGFARYRGGPTQDALHEIASGWLRWQAEAKDVGVMTAAVLAEAQRAGGGTHLRAAAREYASRVAKHDGNGSLMRTAPLALAFLDNAVGLAEAARDVSALTHAGLDSQDACVLWTNAVRVAVLDGTTDGLRQGLYLLDEDRRERWAVLLDEAEQSEPWDFPKNGWAVHALQAAWAAVTCTREHEGAPSNPFARGVDHAVRCGLDTDTVGAIAGGLLGAVHGASAVPPHWLDTLHGWPGMHSADLVSLADAMLDGAA